MLRMAPPFTDARPADAGGQIVEIPIDVIFDGGRLRPIDPAWAAAFAAKLEAGGVLPPVEVRRPEPGEGISHEFVLVVGGHRLAAHRQAERLTIRAEIRPYTRLQARMAECEENLSRNELSPLDRGIFLAEHKRVWLALNPEVGHGGDRKSPGAKGKIKSQTLGLEPQRFTLVAAKLCNVSEATVQAAIAMAEALSPDAVALLRGTEIARNASELKRLAAEPIERQVVLAQQLRSGKVASVAAAKIATGAAPTGEGDPQEDLYRRICSTWERLDAKGRKRFLEHAGLSERKPRERMPKISEIVGERA